MPRESAPLLQAVPKIIGGLSMPVEQAVGLGLFEGWESLMLNIYASELVTSVYRTMVGYALSSGAFEFPFVPAASPVVLYLSSTENTDLGKLMCITGCGPDFVPQRTFALMDPSDAENQFAIPGTWLRINEVKNVTPGADNAGQTDGDVYVAESTPVVAGVPTDKSKIQGFFAQEFQRSKNGVFTVPAGYKGFIRIVNWGVGSNTFDIRSKIMEQGLPKFTIHSDKVFAVVSKEMQSNLLLEEKTDLEITGIAFGGNTIASLDIGVILVPKDEFERTEITHTLVA